MATKWRDLPYMPILACPSQNAYKFNAFGYPPVTELDNDILLDVLHSGELRIAALGVAQDGVDHVEGPDWGLAGNYTASTPSGYWPDYAREMVRMISAHYNRPISIRYYFSANEPLRLVKNGTCHMTDLYFMQAHTEAHYSPLEHFVTTCPVCTTLNNVVVKKSANIDKFWQIVDRIKQAKTGKERTIAYLSRGNASTFHGMLPSVAKRAIAPSIVDLHKMVQNGDVLAAILTSNMLPNYDTLTSFDTDIMTTHGPWIKKQSPTCTMKALKREAALPSNATLHVSSFPTPKAVYIVALIFGVAACVALL